MLAYNCTTNWTSSGVPLTDDGERIEMIVNLLTFCLSTIGLV
jgi:hypothetical protein